MATKGISSSFRSWKYRSTAGGLENNLTLNNVPMLQPQFNQHLVRILAAGLNPADYRLSESNSNSSIRWPFPNLPLLEMTLLAKLSSLRQVQCSSQVSSCLEAPGQTLCTEGLCQSIVSDVVSSTGNGTCVNRVYYRATETEIYISYG
jgi:hypothetical protein